MESLAIVDDEVMDLKDARIPLNDRGYLLGDGVFETLRTSNGHVFREGEHAERMGEGLKAIGLDPELLEGFHAAVAKMVAAGRKAFGDELYLRVNITTGVMEDVAGTDLGASITGICRPFRPYPMRFYTEGVHLMVTKQRKDSRNPLSRIKSLSFLPYVAARREAMAATVHDGLLTNEEGRIVEASTSNIFARKGDTVYAPGAEEGAVPGITRDAVLELIADIGLDVEAVLPVDVLRSADEAFVTNTTGGVVPVTRFEDRPVGDGKKGELTRELAHAFEALLRSGADHA